MNSPKAFVAGLLGILGVIFITVGSTFVAAPTARAIAMVFFLLSGFMWAFGGALFGEKS